jgi:hypothetical protein
MKQIFQLTKFFIVCFIRSVEGLLTCSFHESLPSDCLDAQILLSSWLYLISDSFTYARPKVDDVLSHMWTSEVFSYDTKIVASLPFFCQIFGIPKDHRKSKPFYDHVFVFSIVDDHIWFRNYQVNYTFFFKSTSIGAFMQFLPSKTIFSVAQYLLHFTVIYVNILLTLCSQLRNDNN